VSSAVKDEKELQTPCHFGKLRGGRKKARENSFLVNYMDGQRNCSSSPAHKKTILCGSS